MAPRGTPRSEPDVKGEGAVETFKNLIEKSRNLTLQRDRLQATQVLVRGLKKEPRNSTAHKELLAALEELSGVFYTEKGQTLFALGESVVGSRPGEAADRYLQSLEVEDGNTTILKSLARAQISMGVCDRAEATIEKAESVNPFSPEIRLLRLQVLLCKNNFSGIDRLLASDDVDLSSVDRFLRPILIQQAMHERDQKKVKSQMAAWESAAPDYPEVYYWKWKIAQDSQQPARGPALRYSSLCQNLTPRKRVAFGLDPWLCRNREKVSAYLESSAPQGGLPPGRDQ